MMTTTKLLPTICLLNALFLLSASYFYHLLEIEHIYINLQDIVKKGETRIPDLSKIKYYEVHKIQYKRK